MAESRAILDEERKTTVLSVEPCLVEDFGESLIVEEIDACDILRELLAIEGRFIYWTRLGQV